MPGIYLVDYIMYIPGIYMEYISGIYMVYSNHMNM